MRRSAVPDFQTPTKLFGPGNELLAASAYNSDKTTATHLDMVRDFKRMADSATITPFHQYLDTLAQSGRLLMHYTQNVDCLDSRLPSLASKTLHLHGRIDLMRCHQCSERFQWAADLAKGPALALCPGLCQQRAERRASMGQRPVALGLVRPGLFLYGEANPDEEQIVTRWSKDIRKCPDAVVIIGTRLEVPGARKLAADLCRTVKGKRRGTTVWINAERPPSRLEKLFEYVFHGDGDGMLGKENNDS